MNALRIEFIPWYLPGQTLMRCGGDHGCGAVVMDTDLHIKWHERIEDPGTPWPSDIHIEKVK